MNRFSHNCGPIFCPVCTPQKNKKDKVIGPRLECSTTNYSGCGVDIANCPECGKGFQISYNIEVDGVRHVPSWDIDLAAEAAAEAELKRAQAEALKQELTKIQKELNELETHQPLTDRRK